MTATATTRPETSIDPATEMGYLALTVASLERSLAFYTEAIGLAVLRREASVATLGVAGRPLLVLREQPGAAPWPTGGRSYTGLYHFALLMPTREDLGLWLGNWLRLGLPLPGQGDHIVSEALYLADPDQHGIEIYRDRPREGWQWQDGQVRMGTGPVDIRGLLGDAERSGRPWTGMPAGTRLGHIHLQVGDIDRGAAFYHEVLGFDIVAAMPTALFVSAGGYHHHIGMNVWHSRNAGPAPKGTVRLRCFAIELPSQAARDEVVARLDAAGIAQRRLDDAVVVDDPWGNTIILRVGTAADPDAVASLVDRLV